jgi:hypothetical protein
MRCRMWTRSSRKSKSPTKHNTYHPRWEDAFESTPYVFLVQVLCLSRQSICCQADHRHEQHTQQILAPVQVQDPDVQRLHIEVRLML